MKQSMRAFGALFAAILASTYAGSASAASADEVRQRLSSKMPQLDVQSVAESPVDGLYEVVFDGFRVIYVSEDADYVFDGSLMELATGQNLTRIRSDELQVARYDEMGKQWIKTLRGFGIENFVNYEGDAEAALSGREMFVFTDITCPYCARFHQQVGKLTKEGVSVRYILFARAGVNSRPHRQHINIWCSADRQQALTDGKAGKSISADKCEHPIDEHMELVKKVEVNATPTIILDTGERVDGFRQAADFIDLLKSKAALKI